MKTAQIILALFLLSLAAPGATAQTILSGTVKDQAGEALPGARVYLEDTYDGATTDSEGAFSFTTEETGNYVLKAEFMEYAPFALPLSLDGTAQQLEIKLKQSFSEVKAVSITAGAFEASDRKQAVVLNAIDMVTTAGSAGDVFGALQSLPGTSTVGESGRLFVRGGDSRETQTFIDGNLVSRPFTASPPNVSVRGRFNPFMFKGTIFSTGGYSAEYGQALSSVLLLETNELATEDQLNIGLLNLGGDFSGTKTWENGAVSASGNYFNLGPYMKVVPQNLGWNKAPESYGGDLNFRQKTGKSGMVKLFGTFNHSGMDLDQVQPGGGSEAYGIQNDNLFVTGSWKTVLNAKWGMRTGGSFTRNKDQVALEAGNYRENLTAGHAKTAWSYAPIDKFKLRFGMEYFQTQFDIRFAQQLDTISQGYREQRLAGFVEADAYTSEKLVFRAGGRVEYSKYLNRTTFSPRLAAAYKLNSTSQFSMAYGWFYQDPSDDILLYSDQLRPARAEHLLLNFQSHQNQRTFRAEVYAKRYRDLVTFNDEPVYSPAAYANDGRGYAYGLDLFFRDKKTIKNGDYWISYSFVESKRLHRDFPEMSTPGFVSRHNLSVVYKHFITSWRSLPGATFTYGSPRRYDNPNTPEFNAEKMPAFLSLDMNWTFLYRENIIFHLAVSNVPGFKQQFGYRYAEQPDLNGQYASTEIRPAARRMVILGCFITLSHSDKNQLDKIN